MAHKRDVIDVGVSRRVLRIGAAAYPVQNIARAQTVTLVPRRGRAWRRFLLAVVLSLLLAAGAAVAANRATTLPNSGLNALHGAVIAAGALIVISTIRLMVNLSARTYYGLVIETAGTPRTALVSTSQREVAGLVNAIMAAIDDPGAEFHYHMEDVQIGGTHIQAGRDVYAAGGDQRVSY